MVSMCDNTAPECTCTYLLLDVDEVINYYSHVNLSPESLRYELGKKEMDKNAAIVVMTDEERLEFIFEAAFSFGLDGKRSLIISQPLQTLDGIDNEKYKLKPAVLEMIQIRFARDIREITEYCHNILFRRPHLPDSIFLNGLETFLDASDPNFFLGAYNLCCVVLDAWKSCSRLRVQPKSSHNQDCGVGRLVVAINTKTLESQPAFSQLFTSIVSKADAIKLFELPP